MDEARWSVALLLRSAANDASFKLDEQSDASAPRGASFTFFFSLMDRSSCGGWSQTRRHLRVNIRCTPTDVFSPCLAPGVSGRGVIAEWCCTCRGNKEFRGPVLAKGMNSPLHQTSKRDVALTVLCHSITLHAKRPRPPLGRW